MVIPTSWSRPAFVQPIVGSDDPIVRIHLRDAARDVVEDRSQLFFTLSQPFVRPLKLLTA